MLELEFQLHFNVPKKLLKKSTDLLDVLGQKLLLDLRTPFQGGAAVDGG